MRDLAFFVIILFVIAVSILVVYVAFDSIADTMYNQSYMTPHTSDLIREQADEFPGTWDYTFMTIFIAVAIGILALSYALRTNPILFFFFLIVVVVLGSLAGYISNSFATIAEDPVLGAAAASFPIMSFIMNNYLLFVIVMIMLMLIVFFAKPNEGYA